MCGALKDAATNVAVRDSNKDNGRGSRPNGESRTISGLAKTVKVLRL